MNFPNLPTKKGKKGKASLLEPALLVKREMKLTVGSLFAGIGGFDLGLERTGMFGIRSIDGSDESAYHQL